MKNRCIITKTSDNTTNFICLGENDSAVASNTVYEIILYSLHGDYIYTLKTFTIDESQIKDKLYNKLCYFLQYGKAFMLNSKGEAYTINTFNVEQQIDEIKKGLKYEL